MIDSFSLSILFDVHQKEEAGLLLLKDLPPRRSYISNRKCAVCKLGEVFC